MEKKIQPWVYLWYALYAFAGLGVEMFLIGFIEPILFGDVKSSDYTTIQMIIHWSITILCWGAISFLIIKKSKRKLDFDVTCRSKPTTSKIILCVILMIACIVINAFDWGTLKIIGEFQKKGLLLFIFQHVYYFFEVILIFLIVAFGQKFFDILLHKKTIIPWGGIVLCCTWGAVHILSKASIYTGLIVMVFSILYGLMYVLLERNSKWSYLAITIAFII